MTDYELTIALHDGKWAYFCIGLAFSFPGVQHLLLGWRVLVASIASAFKRKAQWTCFSAESVKFRFFAIRSDSYDRTSILRDSLNQHG